MSAPKPTGWCPVHGPVVPVGGVANYLYCPRCHLAVGGPGADLALKLLHENTDLKARLREIRIWFESCDFESAWAKDTRRALNLRIKNWRGGK